MARPPATHRAAPVLLAALLLGAPVAGPAFAQIPRLQIAQIQGAAHLSPVAGQVVETEGVVTAKGPGRFWIQDPTPFDAEPATSE